MSTVRIASLAFLLAWTLACAPRGPVLVEATPSGADTADIAGDSSFATPSAPRESPSTSWRSYPREGVDLWLHGFAILQGAGDSTLVPYFRRGYAQRVSASRSARGVTTRLDTDRNRLASQLAEAPHLVAAQFLPLYFSTWEDMRSAFDRFLRAGGDTRAASTVEDARLIATFATYFPTARDREWARTFFQALDDERAKFFRSWWVAETSGRDAVRTAFDALWLGEYRARFARYLANAGLRNGELVLSVALGGEGRTLTREEEPAAIAIPLADRPDDAVEGLYVLAHELAGVAAGEAVRDVTSPAEQRDGVADRYISLGAVRGGALLLERLAPELVDGYRAYYLGVAGVRSTSGDRGSRFAAVFPLPDHVRDTIARQIDIILAGI